MPKSTVSMKKLCLYSLIGSVCLSAFFGIIALLIGDFGEFQIKVLLSSLTITGASLGGLCCGAAYEARRWPFFALAGLLLIAVNTVMILGGLWAEVGQDWFWQSVGTTSAFATAFAHLCLLNMARLKRSHRWTLWAGYVVDFLMCGIITYLIWGDFPFNEDIIFRVLGIDAILIAAFSLVIPILHRLSRGDVDADDGDLGAILREIDREMESLKQRLWELEEKKMELLQKM